ncbi:MAG TPA: pyruvate kinase [Kiritimatiellia bacterium]|nr:pyruvate kinase [Kiritimatiellia bacterium]
MRKTKIVATIGPASRHPAMLEKLIAAGLNTARLNFSHGTQAEHAEVIRDIRRISQAAGVPVAVLQDLAGPKIRIGRIAAGAALLRQGEVFVLTNRAVPGDEHAVSHSYPLLPAEVTKGDTILLADGSIELEVAETTSDDVVCRVVIGGPLSSHKGLNLPTSSISVPVLTEKDKLDLRFGLEQGVDYIALSFVRSAEEIRQVRKLIRESGHDTPLIAKIEKHEAVNSLDEIIEAVDGLMIARGDLGVEIPLHRVPLIQKTIIQKANAAGKPVITATQMMRSMVDSPRPTRAEAADVANAVLDGTDAVMLSEESAVGRYPLETLRCMGQIAEDVEASLPYDAWLLRHLRDEKFSPEEAVAHAACRLARSIHAAAIATCTTSGSTARLVAKYRPSAPVLALTPNARTCAQLALVWGIRPAMMPVAESADELAALARAAVMKSGLAESGQQIVVTAGLPLKQPGTTNMIRVVTLEETAE